MTATTPHSPPKQEKTHSFSKFNFKKCNFELAGLVAGCDGNNNFCITIHNCYRNMVVAYISMIRPYNYRVKCMHLTSTPLPTLLSLTIA